MQSIRTRVGKLRRSSAGGTLRIVAYSFRFALPSPHFAYVLSSPVLPALKTKTDDDAALQQAREDEGKRSVSASSVRSTRLDRRHSTRRTRRQRLPHMPWPPPLLYHPRSQGREGTAWTTLSLTITKTSTNCRDLLWCRAPSECYTICCLLSRSARTRARCCLVVQRRGLCALSGCRPFTGRDVLLDSLVPPSIFVSINFPFAPFPRTDFALKRKLCEFCVCSEASISDTFQLLDRTWIEFGVSDTSISITWSQYRLPRIDKEQNMYMRGEFTSHLARY